MDTKDVNNAAPEHENGDGVEQVAALAARLPPDITLRVLSELERILGHGFGCIYIRIHDGETFVEPTPFFRYKAPPR